MTVALGMTRADDAQRRAELAEANQRRDDLLERWAVAAHTSSGTDRVADLDVELARVEAAIAALEEPIPNAGPAKAVPSAVDSPATDARFLARAGTQDALSGAPTYPASSVPAPVQPERDPVTQPEYLTTREAAALLGVSKTHLEGLRVHGKGPPFIRLGRSIRYRREDILQYPAAVRATVRSSGR